MPARNKPANINLLIRDDLPGSFSGQLLSWILTYGRYIIIITQIVVLSVFFLRFKLDREHTDLKESVSQKQAIVESITDLEKDILQLQGRLNHIKQVFTNQDVPLKILRALQEELPSDTVFSTLFFTYDHINFAGTSGNLRSFSFLLSQLLLDKRFSDVSLDEINRRPDGRVEFKISAKINLKELI